MNRVRFLYAALCAAIVLLCFAPLLQAGDCRGVLQIQGGYAQQQAVYAPLQQQVVDVYQQPLAVQDVYYNSPIQRARILRQVDGYTIAPPQFRQGFRQPRFRQPIAFQQRQIRPVRFRQQAFVPPPVVLQQTAGTTVIRERSIGPFGIFGSSRTVIQQ